MTFLDGLLISSVVWLMVLVVAMLFATSYSIYNGKSDYFNWSEGWNDAVAEMPKWISVDKRKPEVGKFVLFQYAKNAQNPTMHARNPMAVGRYEYGMFLVEGCSVKVTHWMPLPKPPKEEA